MTKMSVRNHNVTLGVAFIISCLVMLLFLLNKTHEKLEDSRTAYFNMEEKYTNLVKQFESLYEYKERLESSFILIKEKKSSMVSESDLLKSELSVLKTSHKNEIQRLHDELDACRRREEIAMVHRAQKDEALSPSSLTAQSPSVPISPVEDVKGKNGQDHDTGLKIISNLRTIHQSQGQLTKTEKLPGAGSGVGIGVQPSMDPNQDAAGNIFI